MLADCWWARKANTTCSLCYDRGKYYLLITGQRRQILPAHCQAREANHTKPGQDCSRHSLAGILLGIRGVNQTIKVLPLLSSTPASIAWCPQYPGLSPGCSGSTCRTPSDCLTDTSKLGCLQGRGPVQKITFSNTYLFTMIHFVTLWKNMIHYCPMSYLGNLRSVDNSEGK